MLYTTARIPNGSQETARIDVQGLVVVALHMPTVFTGTAIAFLAANEETGDYVPVYDTDGAAYTAVVAGGRVVTLARTGTEGLRWIKLRSDVAEAAERDIVLALGNQER